MARRKLPDDDHSRVMALIASVSRTTFVTTSVFVVVVAAIALVAIVVALVVS
jgi:hypothetical protein